MRTPLKLAGGLAALVLVSACLPEVESGPEVVAEAPPTVAVAAPGASAVAPAAAEPAAPAEPVEQPDLLQPASGGDGDSWRDVSGREYRLGMVDTPEVGDCFSTEATAERTSLVAGGFRADTYTTDRYGRLVSVVTSASGVNVNVHLARNGFADDQYLAQFRHENPALAEQLEAAFAAARAEGAGLWSACRGSTEVQGLVAPPPAAAPAPPAPAAGGGCHPDYATCIPVKGDGSGRGDANDLDCGSIGSPVRLRQAGVDPYRLDADGDGVGCDG